MEVLNLFHTHLVVSFFFLLILELQIWTFNIKTFRVYVQEPIMYDNFFTAQFKKSFFFVIKVKVLTVRVMRNIDQNI